MKNYSFLNLEFWILDRAACVLILFIAAFPSCAGPQSAVMKDKTGEPTVLAEAVTSDTTLSGRVTIAEDLLVPQGVTLTFLPGTVVTVVPSEGTRTDSQFVTTETEIVVRGSLVLEGTSIGTKSRARGSWGGIIAVTPEAKVTMENARVSGAQFGRTFEEIEHFVVDWKEP